MNTAKLLFAILLGTTSGVLMGFILSPLKRRRRGTFFKKKKGFFES